MEASVLMVKEKWLSKRLDDLLGDFEACGEQIRTSGSAVQKRQLHRQLRSLERESKEIEAELREVRGEVYPLLPIAPGRQLAEQYVIQHIHSADASFQLAKAWDEELQRSVAVKLVNARWLGDENKLAPLEELLIREARILASLRDTHLPQVFRLIRQPTAIVMEWTDGPTLYETTAKVGPVPFARAIRIAEQLAGALNYLHKHGVCHGNIKPGGIVTLADGQLVFIDLSLARRAAADWSLSRFSEGGFVGTRLYSSPEQLACLEQGPPSDMFSLGLVLYELLAGRLPFPLGNDCTLYESGHLPQLELDDIPDVFQPILHDLLMERAVDRPSAAATHAILSEHCHRFIAPQGKDK